MIAVLGSINIDLVARSTRLPSPGETVAGSSAQSVPGGKGANQALAAHRAGAAVRMIGAVGRDMFREAALSILDADGVDISAVRHTGKTTGIAVIMIGEDGENMITIVSGANDDLTQADVDKTLVAMGAGDILMLQLEIPAKLVEYALRLARARSIRTVLNIAPATPDVPYLAPLADILIANETEFEILTAQRLSSSEAQREALLNLHARNGQTIVVTLGAQGAMAAVAGNLLHADGLAISPIDTVGAGDTFCGYFAAALDRGDSPEIALRDAAIAGSLACLHPGAQTGIPRLADLRVHTNAAA